MTSTVYLWSVSQLWESFVKFKSFNLADCPTNVTITSSRVSEDYFIGQTVTCSAEGYPEPQYVWTNLLTNATVFGPVVNITTPGFTIVSCRAYNVINGNGCSDSAFLSAFVYGEIKYGYRSSHIIASARVSCYLLTNLGLVSHFFTQFFIWSYNLLLLLLLQIFALK